MKSLVKHITVAVMAITCFSCTTDPKQVLVNNIENNQSFQMVDSMGRAVLGKGLNAGSGYSQVWARDMNTFIETACEVVNKDDLRGAILVFFGLQQPNGEMIDGYVLKGEFDWDDPNQYFSDAAPEHVGFKNTVETDQETSLIQVVGKYISKTGDTSILKEDIADKDVYTRMKWMTSNPQLSSSASFLRLNVLSSLN